jgi:hypothetical protein
MQASPPPIPFDQPCLVALNFLSATKVKRLRLVLGMAKAFMVGDTDEEAVVFTAQITAFLETLDKFASS